MKKTFVLTLMLTLAGTAMCQLKSEGDVPADLKMDMQQLYEGDLWRAEVYTGGKVSAQEKKRIREASYQVGKLMAGGRIVYGDPVSKLASRIADTLLKDYPELRKELRFYTVKSPEANAFATGQGMIFINAGLVAQAENEAQLAFVLSHEIVHYYLNHSMEELIGKRQKKKDDLLEGDATIDEFLRRHNRSRQMETEADSLGIAMFYLRSPYDKHVTDGVFDILQYSALPFDDLPFDTTIFNTPYYELHGCWLDTVADITSRDNYDDSRSSHPNILTRRRNTAAALDGYYGGEQFVVTTKEEFERIRHMARIESIRQEIIAGQFSRAFYNAWLLGEEPLMAQALYSIALYKIKNGTNSVTGDYKTIEGESQQVYYAMRRMTNEQATLAALHTIWKYHQNHPDNLGYTRMCNDLMAALYDDLRMSPTDLLETIPVQDTMVTVEKQETKALTKYERIKQKRQAKTENTPYAYALTDLMQSDTVFRGELRKHLNGKWKTEVVEQKERSPEVTAQFVYSPNYWVVNDRTDEIRVDASARCEQDLTERIMKMGKRFGTPGIDFSDVALHNMSTAEEYNDFLVLNDWINEFWLNKGQFNVLRLTQPAMDELVEHYGAGTISLSAVLNAENLSSASTLFYSILLPLVPVIVYDCFANTERTSMVTLIVDAREGKILSRQSYSYNIADHSALLDAMLYDSYAQSQDAKKPVGFMGRRFVLGGGAAFGFSGHQPFGIGKGFSITPYATLELALSRRWTLAASWNYQPAFDELNNFTRMEDQYNSSGLYVGQHEVTYTNQNLSKHMSTWSLTARVYDHTDFAPLGPYGGFGLHFVQFTNPSDGSNGGNTFGLHAVAGRNYVLFERLVLNIEARYAYTYSAIDLFKAMAISGFEEEYHPHLADAALHNMLLLKVGIGIIPF